MFWIQGCKRTRKKKFNQVIYIQNQKEKKTDRRINRTIMRGE